MHWCPKGCGKKVAWTGERYNRVEKNFECLKCHTRYKAEDVKK